MKTIMKNALCIMSICLIVFLTIDIISMTIDNSHPIKKSNQIIELPNDGYQKMEEKPVNANIKHCVIASFMKRQYMNPTADGTIVNPTQVFVALPNRSALGKTVLVTINNHTEKAIVKDVGPHYTDDPYWLNSKSPKASKIKNKNGAGIDLSWGLAKKFEVAGSINMDLGLFPCTWEFL